MNVAVIGAGVSGISAALMLARYGHQVTLLEAGPKIAPLVRGFSRQGLHCDTGFHQAGTLNKGGILNRYLEFLGVLPYLGLEPYREDCSQLFRFAGEARGTDICLPQGMGAMAKVLAGLWPEHAPGITHFLAAMETAFHHSPFIDPGSMAEADLTLSQGVRTARMLEGMALPERLRSLLTACSVYFGVPPGQGLFEELALVTVSMREGVHGILGGGAALALAYELALASAGIAARTGAAVCAICADDNNRVTAVRTSREEEIPCEACIYTGHPALLPGLLPAGSLRPAMTRHLRGLPETPTLFMVFAQAAGTFLQGRDMLLCLSDDLDASFGQTDLNNTWLHLCSGPPDACGRFMLSICRGLDPLPAGDDAARPPGYARWKQEQASAVCDLVRRHVPELGAVEPVDAATAYTLKDWVYGSRGGIYGAARRADSFPVLPLTRVKGLILAGQGILLPGLLGATISGAVAAGGIIGFSTFFKDLAWTDAEL